MSSKKPNMDKRKRTDRQNFIINSDKGKPEYTKAAKDAASVAHKKACDTAEELSIQRELNKLNNYWESL